MLHASDEEDNWDFRKWQTYQKRDAWKQLHSPTQESICLDQSWWEKNDQTSNVILVSLHVSPVVLFTSNIPIQVMLIRSLWHCADSWQGEVQFDQYGKVMEQTLLVLTMNYRKQWKRWIIKKSNPLAKKWCLLDFVAQEPTWSIIYGKCVGVPNSSSRSYLGRIAKTHGQH